MGGIVSRSDGRIEMEKEKARQQCWIFNCETWLSPKWPHILLQHPINIRIDYIQYIESSQDDTYDLSGHVFNGNSQ